MRKTMSNMTYIDLTIRKKDQSSFESIDNTYNEVKKEESEENGIEFITYYFDKIKNGALGTEYEIQFKKIPYEKHWGIHGIETDWVEHHRIDQNGQSITKIFYKPTYKMVKIEDLVDDAYYIRELIKEKKEKYHVIPWKEQENILSKL
jgi:hypothetical protein